MKNWLCLLLLNLLLFSCARVGLPVGGARDSTAPKFLRANIDSSRVNVPKDLKELRLYFDEYITLKDVTRNLNISPNIRNIKRILPSTLGNKYILIQWEDSLQSNTTYNFNFGNAIADLNEGNVLPYFTYAFSTGEKLDDIYISGEVTSALKRVSETQIADASAKNNYVVGLYKDSDSINYSQKPYYITKADPDGYFELNYLSPGQYKILAFKDENQNSVFDAGKEEVAFNEETINLEKSISGLKIQTYPTQKKLRFIEGKEIPGGLVLLFEGNPKTVEITPESGQLTEYNATHRPGSDSAYVWFDAVKLNIGQTQNENLKFKYRADSLSGTASVFYRMNARNEFTLSGTGTNLLPPNKDFTVNANYPISSVDTSGWRMQQDSADVSFTAAVSATNPFQINVKAPFQPGRKYQLTVPATSVASYYAKNQKSYQFNFEIDLAENYGSLTLNLTNQPTTKFWLELLDEKDEVQYRASGESSVVKFTEIKPGRYYVRMLVDSNNSGEWETADFATRRQAEPSYIYPKMIEIRPLWENVEKWNLAAPAISPATEIPPSQ